MGQKNSKKLPSNPIEAQGLLIKKFYAFAGIDANILKRKISRNRQSPEAPSRHNAGQSNVRSKIRFCKHPQCARQ